MYLKKPKTKKEPKKTYSLIAEQNHNNCRTNYCRTSQRSPIELIPKKKFGIWMLCETYLVSTNKKKDFQNLESRDLTSLTLVDSFYPSKYKTLLGRLLDFYFTFFNLN